MSLLKMISAVLALSLAVSAPAAFGAETIGGDVYVSGANASLETGSGRDAFVTGFSATLDGNVSGDGHVVGFDVDAEATTAGDMYAVGASVSVSGPVGGDVTASGFSVRLRDDATVAGNARLSGASVIVSAPVTGSLAVAGGSIELDATVGGDVRLTGAEITFGDDARINGNLIYSAPSEISIPASVIDPERVRFSRITDSEGLRDLRDMMGDGEWSFWPSFMAVLGAFVVTLLFLVIVGAVLLAVMPHAVEQARQRASDRPGPSLLAGFFGLAMLIGLVPVSAMTLVGLPLVPIVILFIIVTWTLAYILGAYAIALRIAAAFRDIPDTNPAKLAVLALGLIVLAILNFIPVVGWLINLAIVLLGLGAIAVLVVRDLFGMPAAETPVAPPAPKSAPENGSKRRSKT